MKQYPPFIQKLGTTDPELFQLVTKQHDMVMSPGAIDIKNKFLILLALDAYAGSSGVKGISDVARKMGASEEEIAESLRIAYHVAGNKVLHCSMNAYE
jgi:alkylhydroperoxidase/carboxymuconolactone decarboxylase family protein YurZ